MRALVVEDHDDLREVACVNLELLGLPCDAAAGVSDALELLRGNSYSILITDYNIGDTTSLDIVKYLSQSQNLLPVIVYTGNPSLAASMSAEMPMVIVKKPEWNLVESIVQVFLRPG